MKLSDYQRDARRTLTMDPDRIHQLLAVCGLGLAGEAGEVVEHIKKFFGHGHDFDRAKVRKELGDVLWYVAAIATLAGLDLDDVAAANIEKLRGRYPQGFSHEASKGRREVNEVAKVYNDAHAALALPPGDALRALVTEACEMQRTATARYLARADVTWDALWEMEREAEKAPLVVDDVLGKAGE